MKRLFPCLALCSFVVACGGSTKPAEAPSNRQYAPEPASEPRLEEESMAPADNSAPGAGAAPPPAAPQAQGAYPSSTDSRDTDGEVAADADGDYRRLTELSSELESTIRLSTPPCPELEGLRDRICDLADRICALSREASDGQLQRQCQDGTARCDRARQRVGAICGG